MRSGYDRGVIVVVEVVSEGAERPPAGSPVRVEVRDTALADAEAPLLAEARSEVSGGVSTWLATVEVDAPTAASEGVHRPSVFVHVDVDRDGTLSAGDFITTASHPVAPTSAGEIRLQAAVVRI